MERTNRLTVCRLSSVGRDTLIWGLLCFAILQVGFGVVVDRWCPDIRHPEYGRKLSLIKTRAAERPESPLLLALGTSRTAFGFCPGAGHDQAAWQFNFGLTGIGPVQELICLRRLLAAGVRPAQLLIEIHPAFLHQTPGWCEARGVDVRKLDGHDLAVLCRYAYQPAELAWGWIVSRLSPWYSYRTELLRRAMPCWLEEVSRRDERMLAETDGLGWSRFPVRPADDAERQRVGRLCADLYKGPLADFEVSGLVRDAVDEMLTICRREQIDAALVLMPEGELFRGRYPRAALNRLDDYLEDVRQRFAIRVFDCRLWCDDRQFCDGQHLLPEGAQAFTARLRGDLLSPWLASRPSAEVAARPTGSERQ
ncbi:MAG TPA: hypothetical protein VHC22_11565 [Pirellulales bacterium]|nr:hypothetical protein [Pirellulales bacterium]